MNVLESSYDKLSLKIQVTVFYLRESLIFLLCWSKMNDDSLKPCFVILLVYQR